MKTINVNLHTYAELDKAAQQKAREDFSDINTCHNWWDMDYDDFVTICNTIGIHTTPQQISFRGFWSQGDGSTFAATIDTLLFIKAIAAQTWKTYAPTLELDVPPCPCDSRLITLIEKEAIEVTISTERPNNGYWLIYQFDSYLSNTERTYPNIEKAIEQLEKWASRILKQLNSYLYHTLQDTYEYLISEQAIQEAIESNEYLFTSDGTHAGWLLGLETIQH